MSRSKIDPGRVRELHARGLNGVRIAAELGVSPPAVHQWCRRLGLPLPGPATGGSRPIRPGDRFGRLVVRCRSGERGRPVWLCDCDCGRRLVPVRAGLLRADRSASCGCLRAEVAAAHMRDVGLATQARHRGRQPKKTP